MKKLKLKALELGATELLTREQLKSIIAGSGPESCPDNACQTYDDCPGDEICQSANCPDPAWSYNYCCLPG